MAKFKVYYKSSDFVYAEIEAASVEEAKEIAEEMDGGDFYECGETDWEYDSTEDDKGNVLDCPKETSEYIYRLLSTQQKDEIFRKVWFEHVREDAEARLMENPDIDIPKGAELVLCKYVANRYVYEGDYDCNLPYWDNIDNLIREFREFVVEV